jgi:hypothetical protein
MNFKTRVMFDPNIPENEQANFKKGLIYSLRGKRCIDKEDIQEECYRLILIVVTACVIAIPIVHGLAILFEKLSGL